MRNNAPLAIYHSVVQSHLWRRRQCDGLSALDFGATGVGLGHSVVFLGKTLSSHNASLLPGV